MRFRDAAREMLSDEALQPRLHLDQELMFSRVEWRSSCAGTKLLQPFGNGNPQPFFLRARSSRPRAPRVLKDKHLVLRLRQRNYHARAIFFDGATNAAADAAVGCRLPDPRRMNTKANAVCRCRSKRVRAAEPA